MKKESKNKQSHKLDLRWRARALRFSFVSFFFFKCFYLFFGTLVDEKRGKGKK